MTKFIQQARVQSRAVFLLSATLLTASAQAQSGADAGVAPSTAARPGTDAGVAPSTAARPGIDAGVAPSTAARPGTDAAVAPSTEAQPGADAGGAQAAAEPQIEPPTILQDSAAIYPPDLEKEGVAGDVQLELVVDETGAVVEVTPVASPHPGLTDSAVTAARKLRFNPAKVDGVPSPVRIPFSYRFDAPRVVVEAPQAVLSGRVRAQGTRRPLVGATVRIPGTEISTVTGADGVFELQAPPGQVEVEISAPGHRAQRVKETLSEAQAVTVVYTVEPLVTNPYEAIVRADDVRREVSRVTLHEQEIREVPGTLGDPFRAAMKMPGVTAPAGNIPLPVIRGTSPSHSGFFLDGIQVPSLFHLILGPSTVHPEFIETLNFFPGAAPPQYGRFLGGVIDGRVSRAREDKLHASATLDLINVGGFIEYPIKSTGTSITLAGRFSYTPALAALAFTDNTGRYDLNFHDYQGRIEQRVGPGRLRLFVFGSSDTVVQEQPGNLNSAHLSFFRADLRYRQPAGPGEFEMGVTYGRDVGAYAQELTAGSEFTNALETSVVARMNWSAKLAENLDLYVGGDLQRRASELDALRIRNTPEMAGLPTDFGGSAIGVLSSLFAQVAWGDPQALQVIPGLRFDGYHLIGFGTHFALEPRLSATYAINPAVLLKGGAALVHQAPAALVSLPGVGIADLRYGLQEALQFELGTEIKPVPWMEVGLTGFYTNLRRTVELTPYADETVSLASDFLFGRSALGDDPVEDPSSHGYAYGFDVSLRHRLADGWFGWLSYSFQQSMRENLFYQRDANGTPGEVQRAMLPFAFDRTHSVQGAISVQLAGGWTLGSAIQFTTGLPEAGAFLTSATRREATGTDGQPTWALVTRSQADRLPPSFRLDLRAAKEWVFNDFLLELSLDFLNVTFSEEVTGYDYLEETDDAGNRTLRKQPFAIPISVPLLSLKATY